jgi:hypothetical protein
LSKLVEYRRRASELRKLAASAEEGTSRDACLAAARTWELLAQSSENQSKEILFGVLSSHHP